MIKTEKFYVKSDALKENENIDRVRDLVISEVRNTEWAKISRKRHSRMPGKRSSRHTLTLTR